MKKHFKLFLVLLILSSACLKNVHAADFTLLASENTFLKKSNSYNSDTLTMIEKNSSLSILNFSGEWVYVSYNEYYGYVPLTSLEGFSKKPAYSVTLNAVPFATKQYFYVYNYDFNMGITDTSMSISSGSVANSTSVPAASSNASSNVVAPKPTGVSSGLTLKERASSVIYPNWSEAKNIFTLHVNAEVYDIYTGKVYNVQSFSNGNHADVEPTTSADTAIMFETFSNEWSWDVRPVWVTINGKTMAASINGMPHAKGVIDGNGMDGQICIHFLGSKTHNGNNDFTKVHQDVAKEAYDLALKYANQ